MKKLIFLFTSCLHYLLISTAPQKGQKPLFPLPVSDLPPHEMATPVFVFDGIDYNELPEKFRDQHNDCFGHWARCIRNRTIFNVVCAYLPYKDGGFWGYYANQCEIEFQNCENRVRDGDGIYGKHFKTDYIFYTGESYNCEKNVHKENPNAQFN